MKTRALPLLLTVALTSMVLAGCGANTVRPGMAATPTKQSLRARNAEDPMAFQQAAARAIEMVNTSPKWRNPRLVSIEGHGFDQHGKMVPLLGSYWVFKFWANAVDEDGKVEQAVTRADVTLKIEGQADLSDGGEGKDTAIVRVLDPAKLASPDQVVPFAIALGLKVNPAGPAFNYYDVTYNSYYANPSAATSDIADVTSYYQQSTFDGFKIPARPELLGPVPAPGPAPAPVPGVRRMTPQELQAETAERSRQHTRR